MELPLQLLNQSTEIQYIETFVLMQFHSSYGQAVTPADAPQSNVQLIFEEHFH